MILNPGILFIIKCPDFLELFFDSCVIKTNCFGGVLNEEIYRCHSQRRALHCSAHGRSAPHGRRENLRGQKAGCEVRNDSQQI